MTKNTLEVLDARNLGWALKPNESARCLVFNTGKSVSFALC